MGESYFGKAANAERAATFREVQGWQPIETAPKDGKRILIAAKYGLGVRMGLWRDWSEPGMPPRFAFCLIAGRNVDPTHWMPLPDPPEASQ